MPATHPERPAQHCCIRHDLHNSSLPVPSILEDPGTCHDVADASEGELDLMVSFLGCPSSSTRITLPAPESGSSLKPSDGEPRYDQRQTNAPTNITAPIETEESKDRSLVTAARNKPACVWHDTQGQNNNWCSGASNVNGEEETNGAGGEEEVGGQGGVEEGDEGRHASDQEASDDNKEEMGRESIESSACTSEAEDRVLNDSEKNAAVTGSGIRTSRSSSRVSGSGGVHHMEQTGACASERNPSARPVRAFREANSESHAEPQEAAGTGNQWLRNKKSTSSMSGSGRTAVSRVHRSPQRNCSPSRKKKGDLLQGSSAPAPFVPTPAQSSIGFTNISRASSVSPSRKDDPRHPAKSLGARPSSNVLDALCNPALFQSNELSESVETMSDLRHGMIAPPPLLLPSPSPAAPDLRRNAADPADPTPSLAESDLRDPVTPPSDAAQVQCHLILPSLEDSATWSPRTPHGDTHHQISPKKILELSRLAIQDQQEQQQQRQHQHQLQEDQGKKRGTNSSYDFAAAISTFGSLVKNASSAVTTTANAAAKRADTGGSHSVDSQHVRAESSPSMGPGGGSALTNRPRSSRRHPVLDRMFRHVLASLVLESGPPSSACLASVLGQSEEPRSSCGGGSHSRSSSSVCSSTNTTTASWCHSRLQASRRFAAGGAGRRALGGGTGNRVGGTSGSGSVSTDVTLSVSSPLPCTLVKVSEEVDCSRPTGKGETTAATVDA